jgi:hypothetical protein
MRIQRKYFFDSVRDSLFDGGLSQTQVDGMNMILDHAEREGIDDRHLAYILATSHHETAFTHEPIAEYGKGSGKPYGVEDPVTGQTYYGRGLVQLTWKENYEKMDKKFGLGGELVENADLALDPGLATKIIFSGMADGDFTGKCLEDYIICENPETDETDFYNARKIVNALDRADTIAGYAKKFAAAITHAERAGA